ncbi:MAG: PfkB family carbohydrate kinase [Gammaproteobacteria bacterium]|nr:PfkB family carbohydrate kinase [Gammaproteobacteria bacterium]
MNAVNEKESDVIDFEMSRSELDHSRNSSYINYTQKIVSLENITHLISALRPNNKIVQCHGVFDLLHIGHIKHFHHAKSFGDILIVTITADRFVNKGPDKPYFSEYLRAEALASLSSVDFVIINHHPTAIEAIKTIRPDFYIKGIEYQDSESDITGKIAEEEEAVKSVGGQLNFTKDIVFSSSALLNRFFSPFSPEVISYLDQFKTKYQSNDILKYFEGSKKLKVLLVGEAIIDIYHYGEAIGKSGKEPTLVIKYHREEVYIGGILAVANHLSGFCKEVTCVTTLGEKGEYESFIKENLNDNVNIIFHYKKDSPTIVKHRYIEEYSSQKLFEIYEIEDCYLNNEQKEAFSESIKSQIDNNDMVIVTDYGHGLLDSACIELIENKAKFLAVNTQANASNHGFNCISKYKKADYVCMANRELQLNFRQKHISVLDQVNQLMQEFDYKHVVVTNGVKGSFSCKMGEEVYVTPAFAMSVKDRVGAGDAVLAVTSLLVAQDAPADLVGFIGNVVGSQAVNIMGNKSFIEKIPLMKHIIHLMK